MIVYITNENLVFLQGILFPDWTFNRACNNYIFDQIHELVGKKSHRTLGVVMLSNQRLTP